MAISSLDKKKLHPETVFPRGPGMVVFDPRLKTLLVGTGHSDFIAVSSVRPAGGKTMDAAGFWNGLKDRNNVLFSRDSGNVT